MRRRTAAALLVMLLVLGCSGWADSASAGVTIASEADIDRTGVTIGYDASLGIDEEIAERFPSAETAFYADVDGIEALRTGKIDVYITDNIMASNALEANPEGITVLGEVFQAQQVALAMSNSCTIPDFQEKVDRIVREMNANGEMEEIMDRWLDDASTAYREIPEAETPEYTLHVGTFGQLKPYTYYDNDRLVGADVELARIVALRLNAKIVFETADFAGLLAGLAGGKYDLIASNLFISEERKEAMSYSEPYLNADLVYMVRSGSAAGQSAEGVWQRMARVVNKCLLQSERYKMLLRGLLTTVIITLGAFALGNVLGALLCRLASGRLRRLAEGYCALLEGLPVTVVLLILYYVVFSRSRISGVAVAILGFGMAEAAVLSGLFELGLRSVSGGEREAAAALGFSRAQIFRDIVLPQSALHILPGWFGELIALMKGTSVAGFIAVVDLTKAGDLIRSSTFEAFVPLILVALLYFALTGLLRLLLKLIQNRLDPKKKTRRLKGVILR